MAARIDFDSRYPLGMVSYTLVGWDKCRFLQLGRASWNFSRHSDSHAVTVAYRNLVSQESCQLGPFPAQPADDDLLTWFANCTDSHRPADFLVLDGRVIATFAFERGRA